MKTRYKITITAVLLFVVLDLPFFTSITVINDAFFDTVPILHHWSIPIHTKVSGLNHVYGTGEPIEFVVTHSNFGYYQEYPRYEISREDGGRTIINGGVTDSIHYAPFTILTVWQGSWEVLKYTEYSPVDQDENRLDSGHQVDSGRVASETKPISLDEPGIYSLRVYTITRYEGISIPFEVVEK